MRVLILTDRPFIDREHAMLRRLEVGLIDEGCRLVRATPVGSFAEPTAALAASIEYSDSPWSIVGLTPQRVIQRAIQNAAPLRVADEEASVDAIHAWGYHCWPLAHALARSLDAHLALEVCDAASLARAPAFEARARALDAASLHAQWLAPDDALAAALQRTARRWPVRTTWWGVHLPPEAHQPVGERSVSSLCILTSGREPQSTINALSALARAAAGVDPPLIFLDERAVQHHPAVWNHARSLNLLPRLTLVDRPESRRDFLLRADALLLPDRRGEHRSFTLDALAAERIVIARADPLIEVASDSAIALLVNDPSEESWLAAISRALQHPADAARIARAGRDYISANRTAHRHVRATLDAYAQFLDEGPIPLAKRDSQSSRAR